MRPPVMRIDLADGRIVLARPRPILHPGLHILTLALVVAGGVALAVFPIAGRLTRRLESLRAGVASWGAGALSLRVDDTGNDEVAVVARAFEWRSSCGRSGLRPKSTRRSSATSPRSTSSSPKSCWPAVSIMARRTPT